MALRTLLLLTFLVAVGVAARSLAQPLPAQPAPYPPQPSTCATMTDCPLAHRCDGTHCVEAECHPAVTIGRRRLPARSCSRGQLCSYEDGISARHRVGHCEPRELPDAHLPYEHDATSPTIDRVVITPPSAPNP